MTNVRQTTKALAASLGTVLVAAGLAACVPESSVFRLDATFVYRAIPILAGGYTRGELRAGMDAQYEGGVPAAHAVGVDPPGSTEPGRLGDLRFRLGQ